MLHKKSFISVALFEKPLYKIIENNIDSLNDRKIIGCRKNILSIFVALLTFYKFIIKKKKKKRSHFKMPTLNSDVTVNSYNNFFKCT
jgi:hypothetical protein